MKRLFIPLIPLVILFSCENTDQPALPDSETPVVVEAWIEQGEAPMVLVTHAANLTVDNPSFDDLVEKWCRVTVYDNDRPYVLTGTINKEYTPPLVFTSTRLRGAVGHTYHLVVEVDDRVLTSTATMPPAPKIGSLEQCAVEEGDSLFSLQACINQCGQFKLFCRIVGDEKRFYPSFMGTHPAQDGVYSVTRSKSELWNDSLAQSFTHYFRPGQTVMVKACSLSQEMYDFWTAYDAEITMSENLFFHTAANLPGNINGGLGYFAAYGSTVRAIRITD